MRSTHPCLLLLGVVLCTRPALGWKQAFSADHPDAGLHWCGDGISVLINGDGSADLADQSDVAALRFAMEVWNEVACPHPELRDAGTTDQRETVQGSEGDQRNLLVWRTPDEWSAAGYEPSALALSTMWYAPSSGRIFEADIEFNDTHGWTTAPPVSNDVWNTAVHELGHVLGLDHTSDRLATMFTYSQSGETLKRDLAQDDLDGLCAIYAVPYGDCDAGGCDCGVASGARRHWVSFTWLLLGTSVVLAAVLGLRRRAVETGADA